MIKKQKRLQIAVWYVYQALQLRNCNFVQVQLRQDCQNQTHARVSSTNVALFFQYLNIIFVFLYD